MFDKIKNSWNLMKASAVVFDKMGSGNAQYVTYIVLFLFYVVQYTVIIFANAALISAAMIRLKGGDPTVGDGLQLVRRQHLTLPYEVLTSLVMHPLSEQAVTDFQINGVGISR